MSNLSRIELLSSFFPEIKEKSSSGDREAAVKFNTLACEVVLADLLQKYDAALEKQGPGVLCLYLAEGGRAYYVTLEDWQEDLEVSRSIGQSRLELFFQSVIAKIGEVNPEKAGLIMLIDNSNAQLFPIDREFPAQTIKAMLEEFAS